MKSRLEKSATGEVFASVQPIPLVEPLQERIYQTLVQGFFQGKFQPGDEISTRALALQFGVSQMPVREAMTRLAMTGLLEIRSRRKITIPILSVAEREDLLRCRIVLELMAAENLPLPFDPILLNRLYEPLEKLRRAAVDKKIADYLLAEHEFYQSLYSSSRAMVLVGLIGQLELKTAPYRSLSLRIDKLRDRAEVEAEIYDSLTLSSRAVFLALHKKRLVERLTATLKSAD